MNLKHDCRYLPFGLDVRTLPQADAYRGLAHPSLQTALDSLAAYSRWVDELVLPIAFDWIAEHRNEVYATIPENQRDEVGVVLAAAFELVKQRPTYEESLQVQADVEIRVRTGELQIEQFNPLWNQIAQEIHTAVEMIVDQHRYIPQGGVQPPAADVVPVV